LLTTSKVISSLRPPTHD